MISTRSTRRRFDAAMLAAKAREIRKHILRQVHAGQSGHPGGSLGVADVVTALYYGIMRHDPLNPRWPDRDRFVISKGHCSPVIYAVLADCGYFPLEDLESFRRPGSHLQGHPCSAKTPGIEASTGTLGLGISTAAGMALGGKIRGDEHHYYVLCGDGEQQEGQVWEAAMFANKYKLSNLIAFTDRNRLQTDGDTEDVMPLDPLPEKWRAFGWNSWEIDGHDFHDIFAAVERAKSDHGGRPTMIIANTTKGKGVSFMEGAASWHSGPPSDAELARALDELSHA
ncbi:MAG: transketolase [Verrucomicrobia bacterium]|nr:transketolase [Verrucomicrobiota bacterium]